MTELLQKFNLTRVFWISVLTVQLHWQVSS